MVDEEHELLVEAEEDEVAFVEFDISVSPSDPTLELLCNQLKRNDIIIPFYQRKYVWNIEQASRLVESFLMGLPVPQVFFYVNDEDKLEVIDGQQRIKSVAYFFDGLFGEEDKKGKRQVFKLKGLSERSEYNGKTYTQLSERDQRRLKNATLRAINIKQLKPSARNDSVFHIFERLNTGGTQLKPQEIRNAVYRGNIVNELGKFNSFPSWRKILGLKGEDKNQKDVELILRLFSLFKNWSKYEKPMLRFLNYSMNVNRNFDSNGANEFKVRFETITNQIARVFDQPFRPRGVINSAVLEAVMVVLLENEDLDDKELETRYEKLIKNNDFLQTITGGTTDTLVLKKRLTLARVALTDGTT